MEQPTGFVVSSRPKWVYRLIKALYGLKQATRAWRRVVKRILQSLGFTPSQSDPSLFLQQYVDQKVFDLVHVDDMSLNGKNSAAPMEVAKKIEQFVKIRIEKDVSKFLGIVIERDIRSRSIKLHSSFIIDGILEKFGMANGDTATVPIPPGTVMSSPDMKDCEKGEYTRMPHVPYKELVRSLLHLSNTTRSNLSFPCSLLSRYMQDPRKVHWNTPKGVLRYLKYTRECNLV